MPRPELPIEALPTWALLNNVSFVDAAVGAQPEGQGFGLVSRRSLTTAEGDSEVPALITVPGSLVLDREAVELYAKEDRDFRRLLDAVGRQSARGDILLFLLVQLAHASAGPQSLAGVSNPWTEYIKFLPAEVPVPTLWTEDERLLLAGTSLEVALTAKLSALASEFELIQDKSSDIPCWNDMLWYAGAIRLKDWILLDAWYRSRSLELPRSGEAMVPCVDMVNHSSNPTAYYEVHSGGDVRLLLRPGISLSKGDEITISYGDDKPAAEMLFSYGFLDATSASGSLTLPLEAFPDDPLAKAKLFVFGEQPKVHVAVNDEGAIEWSSPFAYLMCVNEEDGLEFRVLQDTEGARQLRLFWRDEDVTDQANDFETVIRSHELRAVFKLRVVTVVQGCLETHLQAMQAVMSLDTDPDSGVSNIREACMKSAASLREIESATLEKVVEYLENEKSVLAMDENVVAYLGSREAAESDLVSPEAPNQDEDDFS